jgi:carbon starvation protein
MLLLGLGNGYKALWKIFGSSNQLLAALALLVATGWLLTHRRTIWYTLAPAVIMMVTAVTTMVYLLVTAYLPGWPGSAPLVITDLLVLAMTAGIIASAIRRWVFRRDVQMAVATT